MVIDQNYRSMGILPANRKIKQQIMESEFQLVDQLEGIMKKFANMRYKIFLFLLKIKWETNLI